MSIPDRVSIVTSPAQPQPQSSQRASLEKQGRPTELHFNANQKQAISETRSKDKSCDIADVPTIRTSSTNASSGNVHRAAVFPTAGAAPKPSTVTHTARTLLTDNQSPSQGSSSPMTDEYTDGKHHTERSSPIRESSRTQRPQRPPLGDIEDSGGNHGRWAKRGDGYSGDKRGPQNAQPTEAIQEMSLRGSASTRFRAIAEETSKLDTQNLPNDDDPHVTADLYSSVDCSPLGKHQVFSSFDAQAAQRLTLLSDHDPDPTAVQMSHSSLEKDIKGMSTLNPIRQERIHRSHDAALVSLPDYNLSTLIPDPSETCLGCHQEQQTPPKRRFSMINVPTETATTIAVVPAPNELIRVALVSITPAATTFSMPTEVPNSSPEIQRVSTFSVVEDMEGAQLPAQKLTADDHLDPTLIVAPGSQQAVILPSIHLPDSADGSHRLEAQAGRCRGRHSDLPNETGYHTSDRHRDASPPNPSGIIGQLGEYDQSYRKSSCSHGLSTSPCSDDSQGLRRNAQHDHPFLPSAGPMTNATKQLSSPTSPLRIVQPNLDIAKPSSLPHFSLGESYSVGFADLNLEQNETCQPESQQRSNSTVTYSNAHPHLIMDRRSTSPLTLTGSGTHCCPDCQAITSSRKLNHQRSPSVGEKIDQMVLDRQAAAAHRGKIGWLEEYLAIKTAKGRRSRMDS
ncbi:hypothetical protein IAU59_007548 [Kwoniella sp. CBS 9459]